MHSDKRILIVSQHFWPESFRINDIADYCIERGCKIDVLCGTPNYPKGQFFTGYSFFRNRDQSHNGIHIRRAFEIERGNNSNWRIFLNYISFPFFSLLHIPKLLFHKYDKIFIYQTSPVMMAIAGIIIGKLKKTETILYILDLWPENLFSVIDVKKKFFRIIIRWISYWHYKKVDKIIVLSECMKKHILKIVSIQESKIAIIPQVCEKIYEKKVKDDSIIKKFENGFNIVFTGNISPAQSFETIIDAAKMLRKDGTNDINWIIVGDGMSRKWLENEVGKSGLSDCFYYEGFKPIEDIPKYLYIADILISCLVKSSILEATIPSKIYSYIASGRPIVLAMDGEVRQLVNNVIKCGFAGPAGDSISLFNNIKRIYLSNKSDRQEMGKRASAYHFMHLERNQVLGQLYDFIFDIK